MAPPARRGDREAGAPSLADLASATGAPPPSRRGRSGPRRPRRAASRLVRWFITLLVLAILGGGGGLIALVWFLDDQGRSPREWAPYLQRRAEGNNNLYVEGAALVADYLQRMERLPRTEDPIIPPLVGAAAIRSGTPPAVMTRLVLNTAQLGAAIAEATPGQVIQLVPGTYALDGRGLVLVRPGTPVAPITLRAERLGDVTLLSSVAEAMKVIAPHWVIENLVVRGVCGAHSDCEHALHVVGGAHYTTIRNNRFEDFNAHIKINGEGGTFPDHGRIIGNTMTNATPRDTRAPITPIDMVGASNWRIAGNFIADFQRKGGGAATYGAFVKGAGEANVMERNVVVCEWKLRRSLGPNIALSIGGGGTFPDAVKRDLGASGLEQAGGVIRDNVLAFCNDVGIYVNKGQRSLISHNTVLDTAGIGVRFPESSAEVVGNLIDGIVQTREGAVVRVRDNEVAPLIGLFIGRHPARDMFRDPARLDLRWRTRPEPISTGEMRADFCGTERTGRVLPGAFEDFGKCR